MTDKPKFTVSEIQAATGGELLCGAPDQVAVGVCTDSRRIAQGELFIPLQGEKYDGHDFIHQAVSKRAGAILTAKELTAPSMIPVILVNDTLKALGAIARFHRRRFQIPVIAVTGSNGKTTTKELIATVLGTRFKVVKTELNYNNEIGAPLTILKIDRETEAVILEMGMRGQGQIRYLAGIALPEIGVVTNVGLSHLELLGSKEAIAQAKGELIAALPSDGIAVLNGTDPLVASMSKLFSGESVFYGTEPKGSSKAHLKTEVLDIWASDLRIVPGGQMVEVDGRWGRFSLFLPLYGRYNVDNLLAAVAIGLLLGLSPEEIAGAVASFTPVEKRLRIIETGGIRIIDDTYNSSPPAVIGALEVLRELAPAGRKIAILGDMLELGVASNAAHHEIGEAVAALGCFALFSIGPQSEETNRAAKEKGVFTRHYQDKSRLIADARAFLSPGDAVLVKGSRGLEMEEIVEELVKGGIKE